MVGDGRRWKERMISMLMKLNNMGEGNGRRIDE